MLKHLFQFSTRASRAEFIFWGIIIQLFVYIYALVQFSIPTTPANFSPSTLLLTLLLLLLAPISLAVCWMWFALLARRLHDINLSAWWLLLVFAIGFSTIFTTLFMPSWFTYVPQLIVLGCMGYLSFAGGTATTNKYGEVPAKTYAPTFLTNKKCLAASSVLFLIMLCSFSIGYMHLSQVRLQQLEQQQPQYLQQISNSQRNF